LWSTPQSRWWSTGPAYGASEPPVLAEHGMVVSDSREASEAGIAILQAGGNAVDAAVAVGFVLAVTYPSAGNIGGGGFMVTRMAGGETFTLDYREIAPAAAHRDMFLDENGDVDSTLSRASHLASGVPGSVDGLLRAWRDHGSGNISRRDLLAPAIELAKNGFSLSRYLADALNGYRPTFEEHPGSAESFVRSDGERWKAGDTFKQPLLAKTLQRVAREGRAGFYAGPVADAIVAEMKRGGGIITHADLAAYASKYREPIRGSFRGLEILSMPPPSSGGVHVVQMLNMLHELDIDSIGWHGSQYVHRLTEVQRRAYADRAEHLGDPDYWDVPIAMLTSREYAAKRAAEIVLDRATPSTEVNASAAPSREGVNTTHYSVVDAEGNAVSVTTTINLGYGSGIAVEGAGFLLNNEMDDFSAKPGVPNAFGLLGNEANAIEPGKRMLSSMTPTIVLKDGEPYLVTGSPGGSTIITTVLQVILNVDLHKMNVQEAVSAPRVHSQWLPDVINVEPRALQPDVIERLEAMGHTISPRGAWGSANSILINTRGKWGAADPRTGTSHAAGY
jgi:gamma-glutamyltranspeptidase / glutathione hydrolase